LGAAVLTAVYEQLVHSLEEMADAVNNLVQEVGVGVQVSAVTVGRVLSRSLLTRKVIDRAFLTRNEE